ncbi:MAG: T9SS type A sorting domain-containing protein [Ignavibacteria bacterium]|nr:T9SS type A sorting domain-containing protein [Ignavibacteria bacterium]
MKTLILILFMLIGYATNFSKEKNSDITTEIHRLNAELKNENLSEQQRSEINNKLNLLLGVKQEEDRYGLTKSCNITTNFNNPPFTEWYNTDVLVYSGAVSPHGGYRQIDLDQGEDGWMYMVVNKNAQPPGFNIYLSSNGGQSWPFVISYASGSNGYIHGIAMLVESRNNAVLDSTRILVYFIFSTVASGDNGALYLLNVKRTGAGGQVFLAGNPSSGNKFEYVSACSDGMYWQAPTNMHAVVREVQNTGGQVGFRHFRTTDWGVNHGNVLIQPFAIDANPSADYANSTGASGDSIFIAVERRVNPATTHLVLHTTPSTPTATFNSYTLGAISNVKFERPSITIVQQSASLPKKIVITCSQGRNPRFLYSTNSGLTWNGTFLLGPNSNQVADFTICNSDSLTSIGGQYVVAGYVTNDGDSVNLRQMNIPPTSNFFYNALNSNQASGFVTPVCAIYKTGTTKYATLGYAGFGPANVYYDGEHLITGITPINSEIPDRFELSQNYPNPFNPSTNIEFGIVKPATVRLIIYDVLGREVMKLFLGDLKAGTYSVSINLKDFSSGVYYYRISSEDFNATKLMVLSK